MVGTKYGIQNIAKGLLSTAKRPLNGKICQSADRRNNWIRTFIYHFFQLIEPYLTLTVIKRGIGMQLLYFILRTFVKTDQNGKSTQNLNEKEIKDLSDLNDSILAKKYQSQGCPSLSESSLGLILLFPNREIIPTILIW